MNHTLPGFVLLRLTDSRLLLGLQALVLSLAFLLAVLENLAVVLLTLFERRLHTPMYLFLRHLSFLDLCLVSATVPKSIANSVTLSDSISFLGCAAQLFLVILVDGSEVGLLMAMSYDRYVAICRPLHYEAVMSRGACVQLLVGAWLSGGALGVLYTAGTFSLDFCGSRMVQQFFCDVPALLKLSCSEEHLVITVSVAIGVCYAFSCLVCITLSYASIFSTVLRMPSGQKRAKAFSTCLPHLAVVGAFLLTGAVAYLKPTSLQPSPLDLLVSLFYSAVPPVLNPIIYCLRNRDIHAALGKLVGSVGGQLRKERG